MNTTTMELFWEQTLVTLRKAPLNSTSVVMNEPLAYRKYQVSYQSLHGVTITAYLSQPIAGERPAGRWPAIVTAPGYGGWQQGATLCDCQRGYMVLQVFPRGQGASAGLTASPVPPPPEPLLRGIERPEGYFYQGAFCDVIRGVDYLASRPDVDPDRIGIMGTSQGGGIALSVAALDPRLKACAAHVPFFCDMRHNANFARPGFTDPVFLATFDWFDPINLVYRLKAPTLLSSGGKDTCCPPETIRAVFDRLPGVKSLAHYPELIHTSCGTFYELSWNWMDCYLRRAG